MAQRNNIPVSGTKLQFKDGVLCIYGGEGERESVRDIGIGEWLGRTPNKTINHKNKASIYPLPRITDFLRYPA